MNMVSLTDLCTVSPRAKLDGDRLRPSSIRAVTPRKRLLMTHLGSGAGHLLVLLRELEIGLIHLRYLLGGLLMHLWLGLRLRLGLVFGLLEGFLFFKEVTLALRASQARQVIQIDHLFELVVACVAVVCAQSTSDLHIVGFHFVEFLMNYCRFNYELFLS